MCRDENIKELEAGATAHPRHSCPRAKSTLNLTAVKKKSLLPPPSTILLPFRTHSFPPADAPVFPDSLQRTFAAKRGSLGTLTCTAKGAPSISFLWCRKDDLGSGGGSGGGGRRGSCASARSGELTADSSGRYAESTKRLGDDLWSSTLSIADVSTDDFGVYVCVARNRLGCGGGGGGVGAIGRRSAECNVEVTLTPLSE